MRKEDIMQKLSYFGLPYARVLSRHITSAEAEKLKESYSYVHAYSFEKEHFTGFEMKVQRTPIFDLTQREEDIFKKFNHTCKNLIRRAERNERLHIVPLDSDIAGSYALYARVKRHEGTRPDLAKEFENCLLFNAYIDDKMIVTMSFYDNGDIIRSKHIASVRKENPDEAKIIGQASRLINWEVMKWGKANGRKILDFGGVTDDPTKAGIRDFKQSFGGKEVDIYMYRHVTPLFARVKAFVHIMGKNIN